MISCKQTKNNFSDISEQGIRKTIPYVIDAAYKVDVCQQIQSDTISNEFKDDSCKINGAEHQPSFPCVRSTSRRKRKKALSGNMVEPTDFRGSHGSRKLSKPMKVSVNVNVGTATEVSKHKAINTSYY